jgi:hypothetical protein
MVGTRQHVDKSLDSSQDGAAQKEPVTKVVPGAAVAHAASLAHVVEQEAWQMFGKNFLHLAI